jgi:hypothetical protein
MIGMTFSLTSSIKAGYSLNQYSLFYSRGGVDDENKSFASRVWIITHYGLLCSIS